MLTRAAKSNEHLVDEAGSIVTPPDLVVKTYPLSSRKVTFKIENTLLYLM